MTLFSGLSPRRLIAAARDAVAAIRDRVAAVDERLSLDPRLVRVIGVPGLRWMARRRAGALFDLCAGFVYSQVLAACVATDLFTRLRHRPSTPAEVATALALPPDAAQRLLEAATALKLLRRRRDGRFALGPLGTAMAADPGIGAMVAHHNLLYADLADPIAFLRDTKPGGHLAGFWPYDNAARSGECRSATQPYTALMAASQAMVASQVLAAFPFACHRKLLDLGGGNGAFLRAVATRHPHLKLALVDLPEVATQAHAAFAAARLTAEIAAGDLRTASFPAGADLVSLVRVLHDHDDATVRQILRNARRQMRPGDTLLIAEPMADVPGAERIGNVYFPFYLKAMGSGRTRSPAGYRQMLQDAGFVHPHLSGTPLPMVASVLSAQASPSPTPDCQLVTTKELSS